MRGVSALGEIYEFYLKPEFHGIGFGKRLADIQARASAMRR
jgi:ribosomal protein S18 acetylase RimI-like enzyme